MPEASLIRVRFPDGKESEFPGGTPAGDALEQWDPGKRELALAASWNGVPVDLAFRLPSDGDLAPLTFEDRAGRDILQHSAAHLVAKGLVEAIPEARPTHGPPTEEGFFYDFDVRPLNPSDLDAVRVVMDRAVRAREPFVRRELPRAEAEKLFERNPHKLRYIAETPVGESVSVYDTGSFTDLCRGPHVPDTGWLEGVHVLGFSAITQEDPNAPPIQRIRGVGFPTRAQLDQYLKMRAEAEARDHRTLGNKLDLFSFNDAAPGFPFWHPNGMIIVRELEKFVREHLDEAGYSEIRTPLMFAQSVFETSGHWEHYREDIFVTEVEGRTFGWKPMNCPGSMLIFRSRARSYRELPMRLAEFAPLHRMEASGTLHGLTRVREFVQDDAHIFLTEEQVEPEIRTLLAWIERAFGTFRLDWSVELSTRPARFLGEKETWDRAEATLEHVLKSTHAKYRVAPGEGAFYGPKIDIHIRDSLGRPWQTGTIQLDYQLPMRFGLEYQGPDGQLHRPVVVHRTILGTWERFLGVLLEHVAGRLPPWLAPTQVRVLPVTDRHAPAAQGLVEELHSAKVRVESSGTEDSLAKRVRNAEVDRIPWVVVLGDREVAEGTVALRVRGSKENRSFSRAEFLAYVSERIRQRQFEP
ncbi:MAG TPA: threonine--tRNA ligase [Thermoplasmata archaeon]|nr:threonine--tRNA ligase [Thermoplasmata archaeon]